MEENVMMADQRGEENKRTDLETETEVGDPLYEMAERRLAKKGNRTSVTRR